jgi:non-specific serine/threonine protein kinase
VQRLLLATGVVIALASLAGLALASSAQTGGGWQRHAPVPLPRTEVTAAAVRGEIVVVGGFVADGSNVGRADAYSPRTNSWRRLPDLPVSVDHAAGAAWRGRMVLAGGYGANRQPLRDAFILENKRWRRLPAMPESRAAAAAAVVGDTLYVVGGVAETPLGRDLARRAFALDLRTRRWRTIAGPSPREHLAAAATTGRVYALAGRLAGLDTNRGDLEVYDAAARRWRRLPSIPDPRGGTGAAGLNGRLVSVGGEAPTGTQRLVFAYDPKTRRWRRLPSLPTPRHGLGVVALNGRVYTLAGGPQPGLFVSDANESLKVP